MSWYIGADIYQKKDGVWKCIVANKFHYALKSLCETRGLIDDDIYPCSLSSEDKDALNALLHEHDYQVTTFIGKVDRDVWAELDVPSFIDNEGRVIVDPKDVKKVQEKCLDYQDYIKMEDSEKEGYIDVYYVKVEERGYGNGRFYNVKSFHHYIDERENKLQSLLDKKRRRSEIEDSLDYLKLSADEKSNVLEEFDYLDEDIGETKSALDAANMVVSVLEFFSDRDYEDYDDMVIYLFSD